MKAAAFRKGAPLAALSLTEMLVAFVRMMILARILGPFELGFASTLAATYAAIEQMTDTAIFRFVLASPRERYKDALAAAHAIALIRGALVCAILIAVSYPLACGMVSCEAWPSFAWLVPVAFIKSFEHFEVRVGEREYRYAPQLIASLASHGCGLIVLVAVGFEWGTHYAFIGYLVVQGVVYVAATHLLSRTPYRVAPRSPLIRDALRYSLPLVANGMGQAIMSQGDRLFVGATLGLEELGLYAVTILVAVVPISGLFRIIGPLQFAGLHNATGPENFEARLRLFARGVPILAAFYALGLIVLVKAVMPLLFGARFVISNEAVALLGMLVMFRIAKTEPATSLLLIKHETRKLALVSQAPMAGLALAILFARLHPSLVSVLGGLVCGEIITLVLMLTTARAHLGKAWADSVTWVALMALVPLATSMAVTVIGASNDLLVRLAAGVVALAVLAISCRIGLVPLYAAAYGAGKKTVVAP